MGDFPDALMRACAWLSLGAWAASEWLRTRARDGAARSAFSIGLLALAAHSLLAFHVRYDWSHSAALEDAARQIEAVTGRASSAGFVANYAFMGWWGLEAILWWARPDSYRRRPPALRWASRLVFAFMFVNGAVVFSRGPVRAFGVAALLCAAGAWMWRPQDGPAGG